MLENISKIDLRILSLYTKDYSSVFSIRQMTNILNINYSNAFKRIKAMVKKEIIIQKKTGKVNNISLNILNLNAVKLISFIEETKEVKNTTIRLLTKEAVQIDPFCCIGIFGSRVSGRHTKSSDWDVFIITQKRKEMEKIMRQFPYSKGIQLQVISQKEFESSLLSPKDNLVKQIVRNKQIIYNPHPYYNIMQKWEMIKYAPSHKD